MLGSCSNSEKGAGPALNSLQEDVKPEKITVLTWEEYFSPEVIRDFESETGIEVEFVYFENLEEMRACFSRGRGPLMSSFPMEEAWLISSNCSC